VQVQVSPTPTSGALPAGFLGFSVEYGALHAYLGRNPRALNPVFLQLLTGVAQGHDPVLRVGGNSTDNTWLPLPGLLPPLAVTYTLTNDWLATVRALAQQTDTRLILGVNLAADDPQIAGVEARALVSAIGRHSIEDLEIGNEPDLYNRFPWYYLPDGTEVTRRTGSYPFRSYVSDLTHWREILPHLPLAAGALALLGWLPTLDPLVSADPDVSMVTIHRYPLSACAGTTGAQVPTLPNLLSDTATEGLASPLAPYARALHAAGRSLRVDELNTVSCEGETGVSNTFGSALWILNTLFDMAGAGVNGVNIHTLPGAAYAPFSFTDDGHWSATVNPLYYGMLLFASAFPTGADMLSVTDSSSASGGDVKAYASETRSGQVRTTIINEDPSVPADVQLTLPAGTAELSAETLTAPGLSATTGVALGGRSFADPTTTGKLPAPLTSSVSATGGSYTVTVPAASAVLLTSGG
jgi:hypothetical protein